MRRHPALHPLSSEHHQALVQARRLRLAGTAASTAGTNGVDEPFSEAAQAFLTFWQEHGQSHFRKEEELLLPAFSRYIDACTVEVITLLRQHISIRAAIAEMEQALASGQCNSRMLQALGDLMQAHVRFEERVAFPLIEGYVPGHVLQQLPFTVAR